MDSIEKQAETNGTPVDVSIALMASDLESVPRLAAEIQSLGSRLKEDDYNRRQALLQKVMVLHNALETPRETMIRHLWIQMSSLLYVSTTNTNPASRPLQRPLPCVLT